MIYLVLRRLAGSDANPSRFAGLLALAATDDDRQSDPQVARASSGSDGHDPRQEIRCGRRGHRPEIAAGPVHRRVLSSPAERDSAAAAESPPLPGALRLRSRSARRQGAPTHPGYASRGTSCFRSTKHSYCETALGILHLQQRPRVALFVLRDPFERFVTCLVYMPRERYNAEIRRRIAAILEQAFNGAVSIRLHPFR